ncbi:MAG: DUF2249 domain-containing protein [Gorillibacterium sp.]|nr:DUF2249 domain-containing protein [Gorillibacterium sp.]
MANTGQVIELDVRPYMQQKLEPFKVIMDTVKGLKKEDTFVLHAIIKPTPLFALMRTKGYVHKVEKLENDHWVTTFLHKSRKHELGALTDVHSTLQDSQSLSESVQEEVLETVDRLPSQVHRLDNRGLEPPQPMVRTLKKLEEAQPGDEIIIHNDRVPMFLIEELNTLGYEYSVDEQPDGTAQIHIHKK